MERTYVMLKPDAVQRKLMGELIKRIEQKNFVITDMKMFNLDERILREHYSEAVNKPFYPKLEKMMLSGPVVGMIVEGEDIVKGMLILRGPTNWLEAMPGTIRGDYANNTTFNLMHASDSVQNAEIEIDRFFGKNVKKNEQSNDR